MLPSVEKPSSGGKACKSRPLCEDAKRVEKILKVLPLPDVLDKLVLSVACDGNHYRFSYGFHEEPLNPSSIKQI